MNLYTRIQSYRRRQSGRRERGKSNLSEIPTGEHWVKRPYRGPKQLFLRSSAYIPRKRGKNTREAAVAFRFAMAPTATSWKILQIAHLDWTHLVIALRKASNQAEQRALCFWESEPSSCRKQRPRFRQINLLNQTCAKYTRSQLLHEPSTISPNLSGIGVSGCELSSDGFFS